MNFSIRKTKAIFIKELKEYYRNPYIIFVLLLPLVFSLFYSNLFRDTKVFIPVMNFCINLSIVLLGIQLPSYFILEEKEKKTLDVLILSSVNALEFITGKLLPIIIVSIISNMIVLFLFNTNFECIIPLMIITTVNSLIMIIFSTIIALISTNQMHGQLYLILFIIIFFILPSSILLFNNIFNSIILKFLNTIFSILGISQMNLIIQNILSGRGLLYSKIGLLITIIWLIVPFIIFSYIYKHKKLY